MSSEPLTLTIPEICERYLRRSPKTFYNKRTALHAIGFPQPLSIPGEPVWLKADVDAWLLSRAQDGGALVIPAAIPPAVKRGPGRPRKDSIRGDAAWARITGSAA